MSGTRLKAPPILDGHHAMGSAGRAVNLAVDTESALRDELARQRRVWNHFLAIQIDTYTYAALGEFVFYHEMARRLTHLRKADLWIGAGGIVAQQATLRKLERALKESFPNAKNRKGFPRFKRASDRHDALIVPAEAVRLVRDGEGNVTHVKVPKLDPIPVRGIQLPRGARLTLARIGQDGRGYRVALGFIAPPRQIVQTIHDTVGVDMGLTRLAVLSTGQVIENPKPLRKALSRMKRLQRIASRRAKGSVNRHRANKRVAALHRRVSGLRRGAMHRATHAIVRDHARIAIEDLSVSGMSRGIVGGLSVHDAALGEFRRQLEYKARWYGREMFVIERFKRSTGVCPDCDLVGPKLALSIHTWICVGCGVEHDRDYAAARVLENTMVGQRLPEPEPDEPGPKRGLAKAGGGERSPSRLGPPSNVPPQKMHPQGASVG